MLNRIWRKEIFSEGWRIGKVKLVYKKGDRKGARNYRPVILKNTGYKVYAEVLRAKMGKKLERRGN